MKLERLSSNKIKYSISFEELSEHGIFENDFDAINWDDLFDEMLDLANEEYHLESSDTLSIEIYSFNVKEIVLILTLFDVTEPLNEDDDFQYEPIRMSNDVYCFENIEDVISLAIQLNNLNKICNSKLYEFENYYYVIVEYTPYSALFYEFSEKATISEAMIEEYGIPIFEDHAFDEILLYFH
ncbi:adaptor protein MecA [Heyndrickxia ginsengihumi]|uniref:NDP-hexose 2,3-dehydratase n=1 Tax=Heyndrickxia ginsengihumi TaxID=363870 RepID=A0A0A6VEB3_9BACI|nr:adaptor protein MecA [Heyndrickxia ginsengihumi]KHD85793.1 hypothetical protein NG54_07095 [Heyndrickxia ginsengihumi]MBE6183462.1 NDP-hexose 2,3-dehydratase [Bacillus sp. (in: firmicutes)]MCM3022901.1 adaptor protein MecA [Heyndrickxia ginsengihumi]NEY20671.1 NDP-hexose 2,3-dehydratase [Heyndrickxia ginsengihumi]